MFAEHEIDYILFVQKDVEIKLNDNEVQAYRYVDRSELSDMMSKCH